MTTFAVDWDGTCVEDNHWPRQGEWLPGAKTALRVLLRHGKVIIHSLRVSPYEYGDPEVYRPSDEIAADIAGIRKMLDDADLRDVEIHTAHGKPPADHYIDNLAVEFKGDWCEVIRKVLPNLLISKKPVVSATLSSPPIRQFDTGATRDTDEGKLDYEAFFSPLVLKRRAEYMHKHRVQSDGSLRDGDNWQKGIPLDQYMKSMFRHFVDLWLTHRTIGDSAEALCALMFNAEGYLHELLRDDSVGPNA